MSHSLFDDYAPKQHTNVLLPEGRGGNDPQPLSYRTARRYGQNNRITTFNPADVPNLIRWYDARALGLPDGAADPVVPSKVGGVGDMTAVLPGTTYRDGTHRQDGKGYVRTQEGVASLTFPETTFSTNGVYTIILAVAIDDTRMGDNTPTWLLGQDTNALRFGVQLPASGVADTISFNTPDAGVLDGSSPRKCDSGWHVWELWSDGVSYEVTLDGITVLSGVAAVGTSLWSRVFGSGGAGRSRAGSFGEMTVYDRALNATERGQLRDYLLDHWQAPYLIDPTAGSDSNTEPWDPTAPWATIGKVYWDADSNKSLFFGLFAGNSVLLKRGEKFREKVITWFNAHGTADRRITLGAYGSGARPVIQNSTTETGPWSNTTGTEYSTPLAVEPVSNLRIYWDHGDGSVTILERGTAGSLAANEFDWAAGTLHVNIGQDPTGELIEIPNESDNSLYCGVDYFTLNGVDIKFSGASGARINGDYNNLLNFAFSYNYYDGYSPTGPNNTYAANFDTSYNGTGPNGTESQGDGMSIHGGLNNVYEDFTCNYNNKGITNFTQVVATYRNGEVKGNLFEGISPAYNAPGGTLTFEDVAVTVTAGQVRNVAVSFQSSTILDACTYDFQAGCVFTDETGAGTAVAIDKPGTVKLRNVTINSFSVGLNEAAPGVIDNDYVTFNGVATPYAGSATPGPNDVVNT